MANKKIIAPDGLEIVYLDPEGLKPYPNNARQHDDKQIDLIVKSIKAYGFNNPVLLDKGDMIIAGHGRTTAAIKAGLKAVPCIRLGHLSEKQKQAYILADNRLAELATWNIPLLQTELQSLDIDITDIGFDTSFLGQKEGLVDQDEVPEVVEREPSITKPGDIWALGDHRLMCGDSTSITDVENLMGGHKADMWLTDPPYNVAYEGKTKDALKIKNDNMGNDEFRQF